MTDPVDTQQEVQQDAWHRAARTFIQGLLTDLLIAAVVFLLPIFTGADTLTSVQWGAVGLALAKTLIVSFLSYLARMLKVSPQTT